MLKSLQITDYALIENLYVEFDKGLNIITGETGAGKSIILGAMALLLGERASKESVRKGAKKSIVEGIFDIGENAKVRKLIRDNDLDDFDEIILRREISAKGNSRVFVNDTPVNLSLLKDIGFLLVDLHGQHEHQSLLKPNMHLDMLDEYGDYPDLLAQFRSYYKKMTAKQAELKELLQKESLLKEKKELYEYQLKEIDSVSPAENEDDEINAELNILENAERILEICNSGYAALYDDEDSATGKLGRVLSKLMELENYDDKFKEKLSQLENALAQIQDVSDYLIRYINNVELDPKKLEELRERLGAINMLKKKYGGTIRSILEYRDKINAEYESATNFDNNISSLEKEIEELRELTGAAASNLSKRREETARVLEKEIREHLQFLGIQNGVFSVVNKIDTAGEYDTYCLIDNKKVKVDSNGIDNIEFYISTNLGEDPKPLAKVASGGEVSRIMLALKSSLAKRDKLPLLIFDEIDTGVSGHIASKVGVAMKKLSEFHQIIAITHLPQIAALSDHHYNVYKFASDGRVFSGIKKLNEEEKIYDIAKLLSGKEVTENSLKSARELLTSN